MSNKTKKETTVSEWANYRGSIPAMQAGQHNYTFAYKRDGEAGWNTIGFYAAQKREYVYHGIMLAVIEMSDDAHVEWEVFDWYGEMIDQSND